MAASSWAVCLLLTVSFTPFNLPLMLYARSFQLLFSPIDTSTTYFMVSTMSQFQVSKLVLVIYCYYNKSTKTYWLGTINIDFIVTAHQEFGSSLAGRFWLRSLKRFQSGINWSCSHGGSIRVPLHVDLSIGLLKHFPRSEQSKKKGNCVKEFADMFFESQLSTCGFPDIPDDLFHSLQLEGEMSVGPRWGGGTSFVTTHHFHSHSVG